MLAAVDLFNITTTFVLTCTPQLFLWRNGGFQESEEDLGLPDVARAVVWAGDNLCVGFKKEYSLVKVSHLVL